MGPIKLSDFDVGSYKPFSVWNQKDVSISDSMSGTYTGETLNGKPHGIGRFIDDKYGYIIEG